VLHLVQALAQTEWAVMPRLWLVTQGAQAVGARAAVQVQQSAVWGLGKVIALEHPDIHCTCVDLDPSLLHSRSGSEELLTELTQPDREDQIALRQGDRYVARLVRRPPQPAPSQPLVNGQSSYLITGGMGALGLQVAHWLVQQGARSLVLVGRRGAEAVTDAIAALEQTGAQVQVVKADITQRSEVVRVLETIHPNLPPLRGIIHAAGVLDDGTLLQQTWPQFAQVMAPKLAGAWNLHTLTQALPLDFFVCFSSMASLLGAPGQGNYAAANAFVDALAHYRQSLGLPGLSLNWGAWAEVGMVQTLSQRERSRLAQRGVGMISPDQGLRVMATLMNQPTAQVGIMPMDWAKFLPSLAGDLPPLFESLSPGSERLPQHRPVLLQHLEETPVRERRGVLLSHIRALLAEVLGVSPTDAVDLNRGFFELGMDSLMSVEIRNRLHTSLGCTLSATLVFKYPTVEALVDYLIQDALSLEFEVRSSISDQPASVDQKRLAPDLQELSQDEIAALLIQELATVSG
jgi:NAD(P)-dependent dehydrogenase (short-subunit alcohol dehydrogenase family)/acyl carrier protein